jgi:hypothetical protein
MAKWAARDRMRASAARLLRPDEHIQEVFAAQTMGQAIIGAGAVLLFAANVGVRLELSWVSAVMLVLAMACFGSFYARNRHRIVVATDQRLLVVDAGWLTTTTARKVLAELDRGTRVGPASGWLWHVVELGGETLRVHRRYFGDLERADLAGQPGQVAGG